MCDLSGSRSLSDDAGESVVGNWWRREDEPDVGTLYDNGSQISGGCRKARAKSWNKMVSFLKKVSVWNDLH